MVDAVVNLHSKILDAPHIIIIIIIYCLPFFARLHAVIASLVILNLMTLITRLHLQSPCAFRD